MRFVLNMDIVLLIQLVGIIRETMMYFKLVPALVHTRYVYMIRRDKPNIQFIVTTFSILHAGWWSLFKFQMSTI